MNISLGVKLNSFLLSPFRGTIKGLSVKLDTFLHVSH